MATCDFCTIVNHHKAEVQEIIEVKEVIKVLEEVLEMLEVTKAVEDLELVENMLWYGTGKHMGSQN